MKKAGVPSRAKHWMPPVTLRICFPQRVRPA
uniref:Uncharacterized protein n=1 Tax=Ackermannviridae sp. TaxID=2831612 RepID=A0A8S5VJV5_9CAUD|nr:MAG TPA: hypothetical protein [Ackermannviridae sp.]